MDQLLLDSYAAKTCPYALHLDRVAPEGERLSRSESAEARIRNGIEFELRVGDALCFLGDALVVVPAARDRNLDPAGWVTDRALRLEVTRAALESGSTVIWNPRLPPDSAGHRSGEPDVLIRARGDRPAYFPVDVKAHHALVPEARLYGGSIEDLVASEEPAIELIEQSASAYHEDILQLAHYWKMLSAIGYSPPGPPRGAIIGWSGTVEGPPIVGWFDLEPALEEYEAAFATALEVVERAVEVANGAELPALGRPWYDASSCHECPWRGLCGPELIEARHVSLIRPSRRLRADIEARDISTFDELARVEVDGGCLGGDGATSSLLRAAVARARMAVAGDSVPFVLLPEVGGTSRQTARLWRRADAPTRWSLTRRDVELDVDMESALSGIYLWGTLLSYRDGVRQYLDLASGYRGFGKEFGDPGDGTTASVFVAFFDFVGELRRRCAADGRTLGIYCYSGPSAEEPAMRRGATAAAQLGGVDRSGDVEELIAAEEWIDLLSEVRARVSTLHGHGLKVIARATGFDWRADDAGGEASMRWYERATTDSQAEVRAAQRAKILAYNEDDVSATRHLRWWLSTHARASVPLVP